jgi:hypothetical protein
MSNSLQLLLCRCAAAAARALAVLPTGHLTCVKLLLDEGTNIEQRNVVGAVLCCCSLHLRCHSQPRTLALWLLKVLVKLAGFPRLGPGPAHLQHGSAVNDSSPG